MYMPTRTHPLRRRPLGLGAVAASGGFDAHAAAAIAAQRVLAAVTGGIGASALVAFGPNGTPSVVTAYNGGYDPAVTPNQTDAEAAYNAIVGVPGPYTYAAIVDTSGTFLSEWPAQSWFAPLLAVVGAGPSTGTGGSGLNLMTVGLVGALGALVWVGFGGKKR